MEKATIPNWPLATCCVFNSSKFQDLPESPSYNFSYFVLFTYVFSVFLEVSHGTAALTHFSLTHIVAKLLTHSTAIVLTHSIAILIALPHWYSIYSGQFCRLFSSLSLIDNLSTWTFTLKPSKTIQVQDLHSSRLIWLWTFETMTVDDCLNRLKS